jgi:RND superfamily putative drug exporter
MLLPLVSAILALGTALGIVSLLSHVMNVAATSTELVLLVGLGVGVDYALFIVVRHRKGLLAGKATAESIVDAVRTSGRAVLFAGTIVCLSILGMFTLRVNFFYGLAASTAIGVALTMIAALTLLPALLGFLGPRVLSRRQRRSVGHPQTSGEGWRRWSGFLARHPVVPAAAATTLIALVAVPFLSLRLGFSDEGNDPSASTTRQGYDLLVQGFGPGFDGPLELVGEIPDTATPTALDRVVTAVRDRHGIASVTAPQVI